MWSLSFCISQLFLESMIFSGFSDNLITNVLFRLFPQPEQHSGVHAMAFLCRLCQIWLWGNYDGWYSWQEEIQIQIQMQIQITKNAQAIYGFEREKLVCSQAYCHFKYPHKFLEELALQDAVRYTSWRDVDVDDGDDGDATAISSIRTSS